MNNMKPVAVVEPMVPGRGNRRKSPRRSTRPEYFVESKVFRGVKLQYSIKIAKIPVHAIRWFSSPKFCA